MVFIPGNGWKESLADVFTLFTVGHYTYSDACGNTFITIGYLTESDCPLLFRNPYFQNGTSMCYYVQSSQTMFAVHFITNGFNN